MSDLTINNVDTSRVVFVSGEAKTISVEYEESITTATFDLVCKDLSGTIMFSKVDSDFDKSEIADMIVSINLSSTDLNLAVGNYEMQLKTTWNAVTSVDKTEIIKLKITKSLF